MGLHAWSREGQGSSAAGGWQWWQVVALSHQQLCSAQCGALAGLAVMQQCCLPGSDGGVEGSNFGSCGGQCPAGQRKGFLGPLQ